LRKRWQEAKRPALQGAENCRNYLAAGGGIMGIIIGPIGAVIGAIIGPIMFPYIMGFIICSMPNWALVLALASRAAARASLRVYMVISGLGADNATGWVLRPAGGT
jgi:hypothetical protein